MARPGLILDRDGTVIEERGYLQRTDQLVLLPGVVGALRLARQAGVAIAIATNQSAVARGLVTEEDLLGMHSWLQDQTGIDAVLVCPHHPDDGCKCRKPQPGLIQQAIEQLGLDRSRTLMVGDTLADCDAGRNAGIDAALVRTGHGRGHVDSALQAGFDVVEDLPEAVSRFLLRIAP